MRMTDKVVDKLEQQMEDFLQRLEVLSQNSHQLSRQQKQMLIEAVEKFSHKLQGLHGVRGELQPSNNAAHSNSRAAIASEHRRYQELFELTPDGYLVTDLDAVIVEANLVAQNLLKIGGDRLIGKPLLAFIPPSERPSFCTQLAILQSSEVPTEWEMHLVSQRGESFWVNLTVTPVRNPVGEMVGLRWLFKEIAMRQQYEIIQQSDRQRLKKQVRKLTTQALANRQLRQEIAAHQQTEAALRQQIQTLEAKLQEQAGNSSASNPLPIPARRNSGIRKAELQQILNYEAMLKRITDKVRDSLDESHILETAVQELVLVLGLKGCNAALYNTERATSTIRYEYTSDVPALQGQEVQMAAFADGYQQLLQRQYFLFCELVPSCRGAIAVLACPIVDNKRVLGDLWLFKRQEDTFNDLEIRLVQQVANQCAIAIRQARLYQKVQVQVAELEKLNRLKDEFLSTISHELRTPVSNMKMAIQMLAVTLNRQQPFFDELAKPQEEQSRLARYFQILQNECEREITLINDVLDLQRLESSIQPLVLAAMDLSDWLPQITVPFQERVQKHQQTLQLNLAAELPTFICDRASLERIITELLNNACKYTPPNEKITVTADAKAGLIQLSVSNSGIEIPASELSRIFEKFYRIPSVDPWKQGGTGLGLALVQKLLNRLGGMIQVRSQDNLTCFTVTLPSERPDSHPIG